MKGMRNFFLISIFFWMSSQLMHAQVLIVNALKDASKNNYSTENIARMSYDHYDQYDSIMNVYEQEPFAFTTSPLGYALRFLSRVFAELSEIKTHQVSDDVLNQLCDNVLDLSTLSDNALLYSKHQIALVPEKERYCKEELEHFVQKIEILEEQFSTLVADGLNPEIITIRVVLARIIKKIHEIIT